MFTRALIKVHPELEAGLPDDQDMNATCLQVFEKWVDSLASFTPTDVIALTSSKYTHYPNNSGGGSNHQICLQVCLDPPQKLFLKDFVNSQVPYALALETMRLLNQASFNSIEVWTPEVIRCLYADTAWYGAETDEDFLQEFEVMNEEPFSSDDQQLVLPSSWCERMFENGFLPVGFHETMSSEDLNQFKTEHPSLRNDHLLAMQGLKSLLMLPPIESSQENPYDRLVAAFIFLWDQDNLLPDAMDDVLNYRYEGDESFEAQTLLEYNAPIELGTCIRDIHFIERQIQFQCAIGRLYNAMLAFA